MGHTNKWTIDYLPTFPQSAFQKLECHVQHSFLIRQREKSFMKIKYDVIPGIYDNFLSDKISRCQYFVNIIWCFKRRQFHYVLHKIDRTGKKKYLLICDLITRHCFPLLNYLTDDSSTIFHETIYIIIIWS